MDELDAGPFSAWIAGVGEPVDVPCGTCTACCRSAYFIHVEPDETETLRHLPKALLFPAPGRPPGHQVLPFDDRGRCPMLGERGCTIYAQRPRTCRTYDCRVFTAAGLDPADDDKPHIAERTRRWRFDTAAEPTAAEQLDAVRRAARYLRARAHECFPDGDAPTSNGQRALLAVQVHTAFLDPHAEPDAATVRAAIAEHRSPRNGRTHGPEPGLGGPPVR
jgi:Fe-S-cluster containining protein